MSAKIRAQGFTLMEILLALFIFAIVMTMIAGGFNVAMKAEQQVAKASKELKTIQLAETIITRDLEQVIKRPVLDENGDLKPAFIFSVFDGNLLEFTRAGNVNPMSSAKRSTLLRVAYSLTDGNLVRKTWRVLDRALDSVPDERVLLQNVEALQLQTLNKDNEFYELSDTLITIPRLLQLTISIAGQGNITRIIKLPGGAL
jgi:general secretion pathway protein J